MQTQNLWRFLIVITLVCLLTACNLPAKGDNQDQQVNDSSSDGSADTGQTSDNEEAAPPPVEEAPLEPAAMLPAFNLAAPCTIVPAAAVEEILGQAVEGIEGPGTCVYTTGGMASITVVVIEGEQAKRVLIDQILQLEDGCSVMFSYNSDQPDPTPLPPAGQALLAESMQHLMAQTLELQQSCGWPGYEVLEEYGSGVYLTPTEVLMPGGVVSIAGPDYSLTILYTDLEKETAESVEVARRILELVVGE